MRVPALSRGRKARKLRRSCCNQRRLSARPEPLPEYQGPVHGRRRAARGRRRDNGCGLPRRPRRTGFLRKRRPGREPRPSSSSGRYTPPLTRPLPSSGTSQILAKTLVRHPVTYVSDLSTRAHGRARHKARQNPRRGPGDGLRAQGPRRPRRRHTQRPRRHSRRLRGLRLKARPDCASGALLLLLC